MRAPRSTQALVAWFAVAASVGAGCRHNETDEFPLGVGYWPLEPLSASAAWPAGTAADPFPQQLGPIVAAPGDGHYASHARGYLHAPLAKVYEALHDPATGFIHNDGGGTRLDGPPAMNVEPFPVSYRVRYSNDTIIGDVKFEVTYRAGPLEGTEAEPLVIGERYQKTWGTDHIQVMAGSLLATAVDGVPDVTSVEMIAWLRADTQGQSNCDGTLSDLYGNLTAKLATMP